MAMVFVSSVGALVLAAAFLLALLALARIPAGFIAARSLWICPLVAGILMIMPFTHQGTPAFTWENPFLTLQATREGLYQAFVLGGRIFVALFAMLLLTSTTTFRNILRAMADLKVPGIFLQLTEFTVRYLFVLVDELKRMQRARKARGFKQRSLWHRASLQVIGATVGLLFLRAYERGDKVYTAMLARKFTGDFRTMSEFKLRPVDGLIGFVFFAAGLAIIIADRGKIVI
jgi:cobalt/nickel transport system permease protein